MSKYYVKCGELEVTIVASDPHKAALKAITNYGKDKTLDGYLLFVGEKGFESIGKTSQIHDKMPNILHGIDYQHAVEMFRVNNLLTELGYE